MTRTVGVGLSCPPHLIFDPFLTYVASTAWLAYYAGILLFNQHLPTGTYSGAATLPSVLAGKCDDCSTSADLTAIKSCFTDPTAADCTGKILFPTPL